MKAVYFGTPDFAVPFLHALHEDPEIKLAAVVTQPDKPVGRKQILTPSSVKSYALKQSIPIIHNLHEVEALTADVFVVVAFGKILKQAVLDVPRLGTVNVHPSILPKFRGPSPLQSTIAAQEEKTGISIMLIDEKMDHGPILAQETLKIDERETSESLRKKITDLGPALLINTLKNYAAGKIEPKKQDHDAATYCKLLKREDGVIDWSDPAEAIDAKIRAYNPWPSTSTTWNRDGKEVKIKILEAQPTNVDRLDPGVVGIQDSKLFVGAGTTSLEILKLQIAGKPQVDTTTFLNGYADIDGITLKP